MAVDKLVTIKMPVPWRNKAVEDFTEAYIIQTGETPDSGQLTRLANYIIHDRRLLSYSRQEGENGQGSPTSTPRGNTWT